MRDRNESCTKFALGVDLLGGAYTCDPVRREGVCLNGKRSRGTMEAQISRKRGRKSDHAPIVVGVSVVAAQRITSSVRLVGSREVFRRHEPRHGLLASIFIQREQ